MTRGQLIGEGRTAEVYAWGDGQVLKLYRASCPRDWTAHEVAVVRALTAAGVPAPAVVATVEEDGRAGIVFERVPGRSLREQITAAPWRTGAAGRLLARLHGEVHALPVRGPLPRVRDHIVGNVRDLGAVLGADADRVLARLEALPDGDRVCHYDFHPDNILGDGRTWRAIDWNNAALGDPVADVARTVLMLRSPYFPPDVAAPVRAFVMALKRWLARAYEAEYGRRFGLSRPALRAWLVPVAAARLWEELPGEREWLLGIVRGQFTL